MLFFVSVVVEGRVPQIVTTVAWCRTTDQAQAVRGLVSHDVLLIINQQRNPLGRYALLIVIEAELDELTLAAANDRW